MYDDLPDWHNLIAVDKHYGLHFKIMAESDYNDYVALYKKNESLNGFEPYGRGEVILMYYYGYLVGAVIILQNNKETYAIHHVIVDRDYRGKGLGTTLVALAIFYAQNKYGKVVAANYRNREVYAKFYSELGFRPVELLKLEAKHTEDTDRRN